jgi:hypothetical protein
MNEKKEAKNVKIGCAYLNEGKYGKYFSFLLGNEDYEVVLRNIKDPNKIVSLKDRYVNLCKNNYKKDQKHPDYILTVSKNKKKT